MEYEFVIIGGGMVGLSLANQIIERGLSSRILILDKEKNLGLHSSGRNSGVLHCGLYYKPGSLKAKLAVEGISEMINFCKRHNINCRITG